MGFGVRIGFQMCMKYAAEGGKYKTLHVDYSHFAHSLLSVFFGHNVHKRDQSEQVIL